MAADRNNRLPDKLRQRAMRLLSDGYSVKYIAEKLGVSERTVWTWKGARGSEIRRRVEIPEGIRLLQAWPQRTINDI